MEQGGVFLKVMRGDDQGKAWELRADQVYVIGRGRDCNVRVADGTVSSPHARLQCDRGVWIIADLQSTHGTQVNDQRILAAKPLFDRDRVRLGRTELEFREDQQLDPADLAEINKDIHLPE